MTNNKDIREAISKSGAKYWQIAEHLGMADGTFSRKLRKELSEEDKQAVLKAIAEVQQETS